MNAPVVHELRRVMAPDTMGDNWLTMLEWTVITAAAEYGRAVPLAPGTLHGVLAPRKTILAAYGVEDAADDPFGHLHELYLTDRPLRRWRHDRAAGVEVRSSVHAVYGPRLTPAALGEVVREALTLAGAKEDAAPEWFAVDVEPMEATFPRGTYHTRITAYVQVTAPAE